MRLLVYGGREYKNKLRLFNALLEFHSQNAITILIHGDCRGADKLAGEWASHFAVPCMAWPAPWKGLPKSGGLIRNQWMIDFAQPDIAMEFRGQTGTADMRRRCKEAGIEVIRIHDKEIFE